MGYHTEHENSTSGKPIVQSALFVRFAWLGLGHLLRSIPRLFNDPSINVSFRTFFRSHILDSHSDKKRKERRSWLAAEFRKSAKEDDPHLGCFITNKKKSDVPLRSVEITSAHFHLIASPPFPSSPSTSQFTRPLIGWPDLPVAQCPIVIFTEHGKTPLEATNECKSLEKRNSTRRHHHFFWNEPENECRMKKNNKTLHSQRVCWSRTNWVKNFECFIRQYSSYLGQSSELNSTF